MSAELERVTPYDMVFADSAFEAERFPAIQREAETRGIDAHSLERFTMLGETGVLMQHLLGEDQAGEGVRQIGQLLFHAFHFCQSGKHVFRISESLARSLATRTEPVGAWRMSAPRGAGYVQLPRNLFWSRIQDDAVAEPVDGMFWHVTTREDGSVSRVELLLVLGMRAERAGLSLVAVAGNVPEPPGHWADEHVRDGAPDFSNVLPGGELGGLHSVVAAGEVLRLASLCFWYAAQQDAAPAGSDERVTFLDLAPS